MPAAMELKDIPIASIEISPANARKVGVEHGLEELKRSIDNIGLQQPVVVHRKGDKYRLIVGQRRYLACKALGWETIPAIVRRVKNDTVASILSFSENIHRLDLGYGDKMRVAVELLGKLKSVGKVARELGVSPQTVRNYLGYAGVPEQIKAMVNQKKMSARTAMSIATSVADDRKAIRIAHTVQETPIGDPRRQIIETAKEHPDRSVPEIVKLAKKRKFKKITLNLTERLQQALEAACRDYAGEPTEIATEALERWLGDRGFLK